jgi:alpha-L-fucosidase
MNYIHIKMKNISLITLFLLLVCHLSGQYSGGGEAYPGLKTNKESHDKFMDMRFGMFIHWGPVSLRGEEISLSRGREIPIAEYDMLYKEFNPVHFNAAEWVGAARMAGMKYLVITQGLVMASAFGTVSLPTMTWAQPPMEKGF